MGTVKSCLSGDDLDVVTFETRVEEGFVDLLLPPADVLKHSVMSAAAPCAATC